MPRRHRPPAPFPPPGRRLTAGERRRRPRTPAAPSRTPSRRPPSSSATGSPRQVTRDTHLSAAGLTPAAESFLYGLDITTVGGLLDYSRGKLVNAPGLGAKTRTEVQRRQREWGELLREAPRRPRSRRRAARRRRRSSHSSPPPSRLLLGALAAGGAAAGLSESRAALRQPRHPRHPVRAGAEQQRLQQQQGRNGPAAAAAARTSAASCPDIGVWPKQKDVADALGLSARPHPADAEGRSASAGRRIPAVQALREEIMDLLAGLGRVAPAAEIADALAVRRGTQLPGREQRRALALAAVRAVVEVEQLQPRARPSSSISRTAGRREESPGRGPARPGRPARTDAPDTPTAPGLLDYAQRPGQDRRPARRTGHPADRDDRPERTGRAHPAAAERWSGTSGAWSSWRPRPPANAAATPRLEIYPRDLALVRALRLTQAGLVRLIPGVPEERQPGLTADDVHERVRARFPELVVPDGRGGATRELPTGGPLTKALREAGFDLTLSTREEHQDAALSARRRMDDASSHLTSGGWRRSTPRRRRDRATRTIRCSRARSRAEERLAASARRDGFRVLTVHDGPGTGGRAGAGRRAASAHSRCR